MAAGNPPFPTSVRAKPATFEARRAFFRYRAWDGTQAIASFNADDAMEHIAGEVLDGGDLRTVMRRLMQQGAEFRDGRRIPGLRDLLQRAHDRRDEQLQRYNLDSVFEDITKQLDEVIATERATVEQRL